MSQFIGWFLGAVAGLGAVVELPASSAWSSQSLSLPSASWVSRWGTSLPDPAHWDVHGIRPLREHIAAQVAALVDDLAGLPADEAD